MPFLVFCAFCILVILLCCWLGFTDLIFGWGLAYGIVDIHLVHFCINKIYNMTTWDAYKDFSVLLNIHIQCTSVTLPHQNFYGYFTCTYASNSTIFFNLHYFFSKHFDILLNYIFIVSRTFHTSCLERKSGNRGRKSAIQGWENLGGGQLPAGW